MATDSGGKLKHVADNVRHHIHNRAQATVTAQGNRQGDQVFAGAMSVTPGVWLYQLSDEGLALDLTAKGTKYFRDDDLNRVAVAP